MTTISRRVRRVGPGRYGKLLGRLGVSLAAAVCVLIAVGLASRQGGGRQAVEVLAALLLVPVGLALVLSERYEITLGLFGLYLGLLDGVVKLTSGSNLGTLGRDILLYTIVVGALGRCVLRRQRVSVTPLSAVVLLWVVVCVLQVANPSNISLLHAVTSLRQDLEFVPLFFFGAYLIRNQSRLTAFLILLVAVAAANGAVSLVQSRLTPDQLAAWGPGYSILEKGTVTSAARVFFLANGQTAVRPLGLGGEDGFGGLISVIALPALLALASSGALRRRWWLAPAAVLIIAGVITSQTRLDVVSAALAIVIFGLLTATSRRGVVVILAIVVVLAAGYGAISYFSSNHANRYASLSTGDLAHTVISARSSTLSLIPHYLREFPLGAGLGRGGPASTQFLPGGVQPTPLNAESELTFLIIETGIPGLLVMFGLMVGLVRYALRLRRVDDPVLQPCLMAVIAVIITLWITWIFTPITADSPGAPFLWFSAGIVSYWTLALRRGDLTLRRGILSQVLTT